MSRSARHRVLTLVLVLVLGLLTGALFSPVRDFLQDRQRDLLDFAAGHPLEEESTLLQKIQHDLGIAPWRARRDDAQPVEADYRPVQAAEGLDDFFPESVLELYTDTRSAAFDGMAGMLVKTQVDTGRGYAYQLVVLGLDGIAHKIIPLGSETECRCQTDLALNYFHIAGDPARARQSGNRLVNVNSCGGSDWEVASRYTFHHYLNSDDDYRQPTLWALDATDLVEIETASGRQRQRIALTEIINANPDLPIFEARLRGTRPDRWLYGEAVFTPLDRTHSEVSNADADPFHTNDIDAYRGEPGLFEPGDLALSFRSLNLIIVLRPATRRVIWYAYGLTSRQHDPDFISADTLMVYDNNFHNPDSRIVLLEATATPDKSTGFGVTRQNLVEQVNGQAFQQLTGGYQFALEDPRFLVFTANAANVGIDLEADELFLALRHRWQQQDFLNLEIERLLTREQFDSILSAQCG